MTTATSNQSRDRIVSAAQKLFWRDGVTATSPRDIMGESGVGQGSFYHHFPTKHDLAFTAISDTVTSSLMAARLQLQSEGRAYDRLVAYLTRERDAVFGCKIGRLTADPTVMTDNDLAMTVSSYFTDLTVLVRDVLIEQGRVESATDIAHAVVAVVQGGYVMAKATENPDVMRAAVRGFLALLSEGLETSHEQ